VKKKSLPLGCSIGLGCLGAVLVLAGLAVAFFYFTEVLRKKMSSGMLSEEQAADILMSALQAAEYRRAFEVLGPYSAPGRDSFGSNPVKFQEWMETNRLQPKSWTWTGKESVRSDTGARDASYSTTLSGKVVFEDGTSGTVELKMAALGLQANPWRFNDFILKRDPP
jgi:hypothetical protein